MNCDLNPALELGYVDAGSRSAACYEREIARVTAQRDRLANALTAILNHDPEMCDCITPRDCIEVMREIARTALCEETPK